MTRTLYPQSPILLVDDEEQALQSYDLNLRYNGLTNTIRCSDSRKVRDILAGREISLALIDLNMPHVSGHDILELMRTEHPGVPVIVVTGYNEVETAVRCMRSGSVDYLVKPVDRARLVSAVLQALESGAGSPRADVPEAGTGSFAHIVTGNAKMKAVCAYIDSVAATSEPVLITGETGVGKEMIARAVHLAGGRRGCFVGLNVAGLDEHMFSDTLFGHARGAFTSAGTARSGLIEEAAGGTLFLDEIGDLSHSSQLKLLRLIQEREYYPLGSDAKKAMDAKLVVATNQPLQALLDAETFRRDLFFRLRTHYIHIPPLRERPEDLPLLLDHFLGKASERLGKPRPALPARLLEMLSGYPFPGNVRELEAMVFNALALQTGKTLSLAPFKAWIGSVRAGLGDEGGLPAVQDATGPAEPLPTLRELKEGVIQEAMSRAGGNQSAAARLLGISRQALNRRLLQQRRAEADISSDGRQQATGGRRAAKRSERE